MNDSSQTGTMLLCLICAGPLLLGGFIGWAFRKRVERYGFPLALLPGFIRRWIER